MACLLCACGTVEAASGTASWYTYESARKEGTSGICADGSRMDNNALTCASWDYPLGSWVVVKHRLNKVRCKVTDRGPNKKLYRKGRIIDLSKAAFQRLAPLKAGIIAVDVSRA